jgi:molybdopterin adenylyltransferase
MTLRPAKIGILTISDRASRGEYADRGGPAIRDWLTRTLTSPWIAVSKMVPDEREQIETCLCGLSDVEACCLIITTGGTGPAVRDVTPEATEAVCGKMMPGFGEAMRNASLRSVPTAILSRQTAGIRGQTLIINLPGKPSAIDECLDAVFPAVPYCIDLLNGARLECDPSFCKAFRPAST